MTDKEVVDLLELSYSIRKLNGFKWEPGMLGVYRPRGFETQGYSTRFREGMSARNMSEWLVPALYDLSTAGALCYKLLDLGATVTCLHHGDVCIEFTETGISYRGKFLGEACAKAVLARGSWV